MLITDPNAPIPVQLRNEEFLLRPLTAEDAALDYAAVMETRESLRLWEQDPWPADDFSVAENREDLIEHERFHKEHRAFTYTMLDPSETECLGCVYVYPPGAKFLAKSTVSAVGPGAWAELEAVIYFWVRESRLESGLDERLLAALRQWFAEQWQLRDTVYVISEPYAHQLQLIERSDLELRFRVREPGKSAPYLAFG
ncbi:GNAT family N-acetyltransferase [Glutamicibacter sp. 287]|uniref:N-acetyltransferase n=1 Tax=Micrococcaceae TaxID=1268 RepID=UPI0020D157B4|nr:MULTISPECIES: N-acetyltransferase [Micrococcaceae]